MQLYIFALGGLMLSLLFHFKGVQNEQWYLLFTGALLAIGLYGSTYGISIKEARQNVRLILTAVTVGVFLKAFIIGSVMTLLLKNPFGYILGVMVAQIDPLSTAVLLRGSRLSRKAKTILGAWASFDDPATVLMALYVPVLVASFGGAEWKAIGGTMQEAGIVGYLWAMGLNILFAGGALAGWLVVKRYAN